MANSCGVVWRGVRPSLVLVGVAATALVAQATVPKVPFGNQPCQSLTAGEGQTLGMTKIVAKADRAPATLPIDNFCTYLQGDGANVGAQIGYVTDIDYKTNHDGNQSTSHHAPTDLPGAFYDKQGGLWFTKDGYDVVVSGASKYREPVAHLLVAKL